MPAKAMMGEVTPTMAEAVCSCPAVKLILPLFQENVHVIGVSGEPLPHHVEALVVKHLVPII